MLCSTSKQFSPDDREVQEDSDILEQHVRGGLRDVTYPLLFVLCLRLLGDLARDSSPPDVEIRRDSRIIDLGHRRILLGSWTVLAFMLVIFASQPVLRIRIIILCTVLAVDSRGIVFPKSVRVSHIGEFARSGVLGVQFRRSEFVVCVVNSSLGTVGATYRFRNQRYLS